MKKLQTARDRKRKGGRKVEGRKSFPEMAVGDHPANKVMAETIAMAKRFRRANSSTGKRMSFRVISAELEAPDYVNEKGRPSNPKSVRAMIEQRAAPAYRANV